MYYDKSEIPIILLISMNINIILFDIIIYKI